MLGNAIKKEMGGDREARKINGETMLLSSCSKAVMTDKHFHYFSSCCDV